MKNRKRIQNRIFAVVAAVLLVVLFCAPVFASEAEDDFRTGNNYASSGGLSGALTEKIDLTVLSAGRTSALKVGTLSDSEYSDYLGYVIYNQKNAGSCSIADYLRCSLAVGAAGGNPSNVGSDSNGNPVDLLYKGLFSRSMSALEGQGPETVALALLSLDANNIFDSAVSARTSDISRTKLKKSLIASAQKLSAQSSPDVIVSAYVLSALAPYQKEADVSSAVDGLLQALAKMQKTDGSFGGCRATAWMTVALCELGINPEDSGDYFEYGTGVFSALTGFRNNDGGFSEKKGGSSSVDATAAACCGCAAYMCYTENTRLFDFTGIGTQRKASSIGGSSQGNSSKFSQGSSSQKSQSKSSSGSSSKSSSKSSSSSGGNSAGTEAPASSSADSAETKTLNSSGTMIEKAVFEDIMGTDETYVYEGVWGEEEPYTIAFKGSEISKPMDFNAGITAVMSHQLETDAAAGDAEYICFLHQGAFPGRAAVTITVSVPDGKYNCYHYSDSKGCFEEISEVTVSSGMCTFFVTEGGDYFLTSGTVKTGDIRMSYEDTVNGVVPASVFQGIQGTDGRLVLSGTTEEGIPYEIVFDGQKVDYPVDFDMTLTKSGGNTGDILKSAPDAYPLHFSQDGEIPGPAEVTVYDILRQDIPYGLYYYDDGNGKYSGEVTVTGESFTFTVTHCCDYYIDRWSEDGSAGAHSVNYMLIFLIIQGVLVLIAAGALIYRRKKSGLPLFGKKLSAVSLKKQPSAAGEIPEESGAEEVPAEEENITADGMFPLEKDEFPTDEVSAPADGASFDEQAKEAEIDYSSFMPPDRR